MKYAITCENEQVFQHFGKCPSFLVVEIEGQVIVHRKLLSAQGSGHGALVGLLSNEQIETLVCGGIGQGARNALASAHIELLSGAQGSIEEILKQLLAGTLKDDPSGQCHHHHDGAGHSCADHTCKN